MANELEKRIEEARKKWREIAVPLLEAVERSERLTEKDYMVTVGPCELNYEIQSRK